MGYDFLKGPIQDFGPPGEKAARVPLGNVLLRHQVFMHVFICVDNKLRVICVQIPALHGKNLFPVLLRGSYNGPIHGLPVLGVDFYVEKSV